MKALSELSDRCDLTVWSSVFGDLRRLSEGRSLELSPGWMKEYLPEDGDGDIIQEEERTWQDPSAHKMRVAVSSWTGDRVPKREIVKVCHLSVVIVLFPEILDRCKSQLIGLILYLITHNY